MNLLVSLFILSNPSTALICYSMTPYVMFKILTCPQMLIGYGIYYGFRKLLTSITNKYS